MRRLVEVGSKSYDIKVTTVAEIESAIEHLPMDQVREVFAWLEEYQATSNASSEVFAVLDEEEGEGGQWQDPQ